jgi:uncharacterized protein (TIRG00374 family)
MTRVKREWLLGTAITLLSLALALRQVNVPSIITAFRKAHYVLLILAFGLVMASTISTVARWRVLLVHSSGGLGQLFRIFMIAHVFNVVYPAKLGTLLRAHLVGEMSDINKGFAIGTVLGEKILDNIVGLCLVLLLLPIIPSSPWLHRIMTAGAITLLFAVIVLMFLFWFHRHLLPEVVRRVNLFQRGWAKTLSTYLSQGLEGLAAANRRGTRLSVLLLTLTVAGTNWLVVQIALWALRIHVPWVVPPLLLGVLQWGTEVPSAPGNIGVFHYLCLLTLNVFGVEPSLAFSYGVILHMLIMVLPTFIGLACLWSARAFIWSWRQQEGTATLVAPSREVL